MSVNLFAVVDRLPADLFLRLVRPVQGLTGADAARLARRTLREYLGTFGGRSHNSWQEAWNTLTGATVAMPGVLRVSVFRCESCDGHGWTSSGSAMVRGAARGLPMGACPDCNGSGNAFREYLIPALFAQ